jgi:hypothetical protein
MNQGSDVARFRADDPDELVKASLACNLCLGIAEVDWRLTGDDGYDPSVQCECHRCETRWWVYVTPEQALRLELMAARAR